MNKSDEETFPELNGVVTDPTLDPNFSNRNFNEDNVRNPGIEHHVITRESIPSTVVTKIQENDRTVVNANRPIVDHALDNVYEIVGYGTVEERDKDNNLVLIPYVDVEIHPSLDANNRPRKRYKGEFIPTRLVGEVQKLLNNKDTRIVDNSVQLKGDTNLAEVHDTDSLPKHNTEQGVINKTPDSDLLTEDGLVKLGV